VLEVMSCCSTGENRVPTGADRGEERLSVSSRKGFVEVGRGGRDPDVAEPAGDKARFLKGLLEARLTARRGEI
jgi:hypothetical protein